MSRFLVLGAALAATLLCAPPSLAAGADGSAFQVVLVPEAGRTVLYLADADSNAPVGGAAIDAEAVGWQGSATAAAGEGVYVLAWTPPAGGADVTLTILADGRDDLILVQGVGAAGATPVAAADPSAAWLLLLLPVLGGAALLGGTVWRRRAAAAVLALLASGPAFAHSGHDHGAPEPAAAGPQPGAVVSMPKPTQFLLGIRTQRIEPRQAADSVRVVGRVVPDPAGYARVQPSQPARVVSDPAHPLPVPGQTVRRGEVLAVLDPALTTIERGEKRASLTKVDGDIALQERELSRAEQLAGLVPAKTVESLRIRLDQLRKERTQITGTSLGRELVLAPVDGVVTDVHVVPGEVVTPDKVVVEVVEPGRLRVEAVVHDLMAAEKVSAATASTRLLPDHVFDLRLLGVSPRLDPVDQGVHVHFAVAPEQSHGLRLGMPLDVYLITGAERLRTAVPREAVVEAGGRQVVFVRTGPESFEARPVKVERVIGPLADVSGVKAGERIVVQGMDQLKAAR
ncbi:MAG: efflux RND transporter periplasmic adaptor subunit [Magnetospirillum sp.]|nr:efflux RND transporter periplasmic adaptor subunit [Magnetospirillum sp.]